ncbi:MAG TPA: uridine diphosphate-N-acetylglucosamine-binding protein YvcK [Planctomycetes bacterium]|nr:uridine diphosphate-N-acetylglucosamine-binding protein YvcK [Planctomycetota bacterium]
MKVQSGDRPLRIVALGGGTGLHGLLNGLHRRGDDLTAIITVADDGGSSGRLRKDFEIPPPGDIRNCLVALSDADPILGELFQYRFEDSMLEGHAFGNLFIAVLTRLTGDFRGAIERARALLGVRGRVIPATETMVVLVAEHPDGSKSTGEQVISLSGKPIRSIRLVPVPPPVSQEIVDAIESADLVVLGPGSLYTSIIPNLLVPGMVEALNRSKAPIVVVSNLMTQPGETDGFDAIDHLEALTRLDPSPRVEAVIVPSDRACDRLMDLYAEAGSFPVTLDSARAAEDELLVLRTPVIEDGPQIRHDPLKLAEGVHEIYARIRSRGVNA